MPWALVVENRETGKPVLIRPEDKIDPDDPRYGEDVHIVPCKLDKNDSSYLSFGAHEFNRGCACHPTVEEYCFNRTKVLHHETVN